MPASSCSHGYQNKANCKKCSPHLMCRHDTFKRRCVICTGGCEHGKKRYACMKCNASLLCVHELWKYSCPVCWGNKAVTKKNTAQWGKIMRVKMCQKAKDQFMHPAKHITKDDQTSSFLSYEMQTDFVESLWQDVENTE